MVEICCLRPVYKYRFDAVRSHLIRVVKSQIRHGRKPWKPPGLQDGVRQGLESLIVI